jgi:hypothetical protein
MRYTTLPFVAAPAHQGATRRMTRACGLLVVVALGCGSIGCAEPIGRTESAEAVLAPHLTSTSETVLRRSLVTMVRPQCPPDEHYPPGAVAVAAVNIGTNGHVVSVDVQEAPTAAAAAAFRQAVRQWVFRPLEPTKPGPELLASTVTMYFVSAAEACRVASPEEVRYIGRWK